MALYVDEKRRRIEQFASYLRLMGLRRHKVVKGDCFIIFDESAPEDADAPHIKESAAIRVDCLANGGRHREGNGRRSRRPTAGCRGILPLHPVRLHAGLLLPGIAQQHGLSQRGRADPPAAPGILLRQEPAGPPLGHGPTGRTS